MSRGCRGATSRDNEPPMPEPIAYFLTWTTYGSWLPGDQRGWVQYRRGIQLPNPVHEKNAAGRMTESCCFLDHEERSLVEDTIRDHCRIRRWTLYAVNCRSNHVHVVVAADCHPNLVREQFKAWCTRRLKELAKTRRTRSGASPPFEQIRQNWWAERGSGCDINDEDGLEAVVFYVREAQDRPRESEASRGASLA
jgi:REP element-mobilizing transposase RayT